jgi:hypothetical protein
VPSKPAPDLTIEFAKLIGNAVAAGSIDRREVADLANAVLNGPCHRAERLGQLVAAAVRMRRGICRSNRWVLGAPDRSRATHTLNPDKSAPEGDKRP